MTRIWSSMSDIYIDADGCPVIEETLQAGEDFGFPVILVCDTFSQCVMSAVWSVSMAITEIMRKSGHSRTMNGFWMVCMHCVKVCRINKNGYTGCFPHLFEWGIP